MDRSPKYVVRSLYGIIYGVSLSTWAHGCGPTVHECKTYEEAKQVANRLNGDM